MRLVLLCLGFLVTALAGAATPALPDIAYERFQLDNGLTVVVHEDRKAPVVAVSIWYHVGSKDEPAGRSGFAHLFEHLMFQGSEHYNDEYFKPFEQVGATDMNGTTWLDRTNYFQTVPKTALDMALWMESDRMGHLLGAIDQARLDEQRGVVKNEKRQGENQPYGRAFDALQRASFPEGHPYRWTTIGSMEDLEAATLDDVKEWFEEHYGAANAVLVLAGDIDVATAREKVQRYFGAIRPGPPLSRREAWVAARHESTREVMQDRVPRTRIYQSWNIAERGQADAEYLELAANILGGGKTSRLYRRLVLEEGLADSVSASTMSFELAGLFLISADVKQGGEVAPVEQAIHEEVQRFLREGPTAEELARAQTEIRAGFIRGVERVGGFYGKAAVLAECQLYDGDPGCFRQSLRTLLEARTEDLRGAAQRWLGRGDHTLLIEPFGKFQAAAQDPVARKDGPPMPSDFPSVNFPELERAQLKNGIPVVLAQRRAVPVVNIELLFDAGSAADAGRHRGVAAFTGSMLDEGAAGMDSVAIATRAESLGAQLYTSTGLDTTYAGVSALADRLPESVELLRAILREPEFPEQEIERLRAQWLSGIAQEKAQPTGLGLRLMPQLLFPPDHPYAAPFSGTGTEASVNALKRADLLAFHRDFLRPDNARILVVGDITLDALLPLLEENFGDWRAPAASKGQKNLAPVALPEQARVFLLDRPGADQSLILAGLLAPSSKAENQIEISTMNSILGGGFTSRLNMNLREDKHWSYGAGSSLPGALGPRPWFVYAPVQTDKTAAAISEIQKELGAYIGAAPANAEELAKIVARDVRSMPGGYETANAVMSAVRSILVFGRPDDYIESLKGRIEAQSLERIHAAAREVIQPERLTWVIVGDLAKIEAELRALQLGVVQRVDENGQPLPLSP